MSNTLCLDCGQEILGNAWEPVLVPCYCSLPHKADHAQLCMACIAERSNVWEDTREEYLHTVYPYLVEEYASVSA